MKVFNFNNFFPFYRNALSVFTSLLNIIFSYDPVGYGLPYNYLMFTDSREALVEICCQILCVCLEFNVAQNPDLNDEVTDKSSVEAYSKSNLFISYISRIHRDEVLVFVPFTILNLIFYVNFKLI